jgi:DNA-binding IscR family transcriptional regulator
MAYKLSPLGENRAKKIERQLNTESTIMCFMYENKDPVEVEEVAGETHMTEEQAQKVLNRLVSAEYVKEV